MPNVQTIPEAERALERGDLFKVGDGGYLRPAEITRAGINEGTNQPFFITNDGHYFEHDPHRRGDAGDLLYAAMERALRKGYAARNPLSGGGPTNTPISTGQPAIVNIRGETEVPNRMTGGFERVGMEHNLTEAQQNSKRRYDRVVVSNNLGGADGSVSLMMVGPRGHGTGKIDVVTVREPQAINKDGNINTKANTPLSGTGAPYASRNFFGPIEVPPNFTLALSIVIDSPQAANASLRWFALGEASYFPGTTLHTGAVPNL